MSLLSLNIKKFSLKEVKLPALKERELKPLEIEFIERDPKEIFYNKLINTYPAFKELVNTFDLIIY
jgi:NADPH-dependent glutamate synthase beta subunit-like oxidoreductase